MIDGERSGGTRFNTEKPGFFWAVPLMGLRLIARVTAHGAKKYAPLDWAEGQSFSTLLDCIMRHLLQVFDRGPWAKDPESGLYHMSHVGWNVLCMLHFMETGQEDLDDVTPWQGITTAERNERDMGLLREGETGEASFTITRESNPPEDDKVYVGPLQWPEASPLGAAQRAVERERSFAPTGLKGFVREANEVLDGMERITKNRKERERIRKGSADKDEFADIRGEFDAIIFGDTEIDAYNEDEALAGETLVEYINRRWPEVMAKAERDFTPAPPASTLPTDTSLSPIRGGVHQYRINGELVTREEYLANLRDDDALRRTLIEREMDEVAATADMPDAPKPRETKWLGVRI